MDWNPHVAADGSSGRNRSAEGGRATRASGASRGSAGGLKISSVSDSEGDNLGSHRDGGRTGRDSGLSKGSASQSHDMHKCRGQVWVALRSLGMSLGMHSCHQPGRVTFLETRFLQQRNANGVFSPDIGSGVFRRVPKDSRGFWKVPQGSGSFQCRVPDGSARFRKIPE